MGLHEILTGHTCEQDDDDDDDEEDNGAQGSVPPSPAAIGSGAKVPTRVDTAQGSPPRRPPRTDETITSFALVDYDDDDDDEDEVSLSLYRLHLMGQGLGLRLMTDSVYAIYRD